MSDDLQNGINQACVYFYGKFENEYGKFENEQQVEDLVNKKDNKKQLRVRDMNVLLMLGIGYLIAKGHLYYCGSQHYGINISGFRYYKSLVENGDIVL